MKEGKKELLFPRISEDLVPMMLSNCGRKPFQVQ